jgi:hypothetical protein
MKCVAERRKRDSSVTLIFTASGDKITCRIISILSPKPSLIQSLQTKLRPNLRNKKK